MQTTLRQLLLVTAFTGLTMPASAQQPPPLGAVRVTLVAGKIPSKGGRTEVVRRANRVPQNLIILDRNATAEDLAAALRMVSALRAQHGDRLTDDFRARPERVRHGARWNGSEYRKWLQDQLKRLRQAPDRNFADLGVVKAVHITLPASRGVLSADDGKK